jgi:hypothetical protein
MLTNTLSCYRYLQPTPHDLRQQGRRPGRARNAKVTRRALQAFRQELLHGGADGGWPARARCFQQAAPTLVEKALQPAPDGIVTLLADGSDLRHRIAFR